MVSHSVNQRTESNYIMLSPLFLSTVTGAPRPAENQHEKHGGVDIPCRYEITLKHPMVSTLDVLDVTFDLPVLDETPITVSSLR
jgi:hypothetical protein